MFLFNKKKEIKKIGNQMTQKVKVVAQNQICSFCEKSLCTKIAFGSEVKPVLTCNNCELKAVGGVIHRLSEQNLINITQFSQILTTQLINYQSAQSEVSQNKKQIEFCLQLVNRVKQNIELIKQQTKILKENTEKKLNTIANESDQLNKVLIFQQIQKSLTQKRLADIGQIIVKRSFVGTTGLQFWDQYKIQLQNQRLSNEISTIKKQVKVKLKDLNSLVDEINNLSL